MIWKETTHAAYARYMRQKVMKRNVRGCPGAHEKRVVFHPVQRGKDVFTLQYVRAPLTLGVLCMLASCTTLTYEGETFEPSDTVDVYFAMADVAQPYVVIGEVAAYAQAGAVSVERMQRVIVKAALERGADGLVYDSTELTTVPNRDYAQEFRDPEERPAFGPAPYNRVRSVKARLIKYSTSQTP